MMTDRAVSPHPLNTEPQPHPVPDAEPASRPAVRRTTSVVGGFYLVMAGINIGLSLGAPQSYQSFADRALFSWVTDAWGSVFMAAPVLWATLLGLGEILLGGLLLAGGRWARAGLLGVITFHLALLLFSWWAWLWAVPALALVTPLTVAHWRTVDTSTRRTR